MPGEEQSKQGDSMPVLQVAAHMSNGQRVAQWTNSQSRKDDATSTGPIDWGALQPITLAGLKLFNVAKGRKLEGVIIAPPGCQVTPHMHTPHEQTTGHKASCIRTHTSTG